MMKTGQIVGLLIVIILVVGSIAYLEGRKAGPGAIVVPASDIATTTTGVYTDAMNRINQKSKLYPRAKEIVAPSGFVNTDGKPITLGQYIGKKVILLDIMTYSCINCIRTFPYLVDWYKKYEDKGLIIIGIHTPEFDFEKDINNVKAAMAKYGITFPVVLDNDYGTWTAYRNQYWPRKYLIDIDGFIRYDHIGEGGYDETEQKIQELLKERADALGLGTTTAASVEMSVVSEGGAPVSPGQTGETYFGSERGNGLAGWKLSGNWTAEPQYLMSKDNAATITYPVTTKNIYLVASADEPVKVDVLIDGKRVNTVTVQEARLYDLYNGESFGSHVLELKAESKGLRVFTLTFGN